MTTQTQTLSRPQPEWYLGSLIEWHLDAAATDGSLAVAEIVVRPGGEPPLHVHAREDEAFHVLDGEMTFQRGTELIEAGPGASVFLPRGIQHGFAVRTSEARVLTFVTPAGLEEAFRACSVPAPERAMPPSPEGPPEPEVVATVTAEFVRHGVTFVGPPLPALLG